MTSALLLPLLLAVQAAPSDRPALRLDVWPQNFVRYGEPVRVTVRPERDGFLTVLRVDTHGRMFALFPVDPDDDAFVRAGERVYLHDRWGNQAFVAVERDGRGTVFAALSDRPYDFRDFSAGGLWSYQLTGVRYAGADHLAALLDLVEYMAKDGHFDYAVETYWVATRQLGFYPAGYLNSCYGFSPYGFGSRYGPGWSYWSPLLDPYHPFWFGYDFYSPYGYDPYGCYGPGILTYYPVGGGTIIGRRPRFPVDREGFKKKKGEIVKPFEPRRREPGTVVVSGRDVDLRTAKPLRIRDDQDRATDWSRGGRDWSKRVADEPRFRGLDLPQRDKVDTRSRDPSIGGRSVKNDPGQKPAPAPAAKPSGGGSSKPANTETKREKPH